MFPLIVKVLVPVAISVLILDEVATVIVPLIVAACAPLTNLIAPVLLSPVPLIVIVSGIDNAAEVPLISKAAPVPTVVPTEPAAPKALLFAICITPAVIDVVPA